ncbi:ribonuclease H-like domain-containing protein, partial [Tanacetum coccineum]
MDKSRSYLTHDKHQVLFDALLNSILLDDAVARGQADPENVLRKRDRDDKDPSAGPNQGKKTKRSRTKESEPSKKSSTSKESSKEGCGEVVGGEERAGEGKGEEEGVGGREARVGRFNNIVSAAKDPLTFDELMATLNDFSKYAINRLKIDNLTQAHLVGPVYKLLKGTCTSSIELEYNMEEYFKALTDKLDWNNPEGDRCPFNLTKPLPLKGCPGRLTVAAEYIFNNDLDFLKSSDPEKEVHYVYHEDQSNSVYSTQNILSMVNVNVKKLHGYGHLEEIVVRRVDRQLYKFKEGDFVDLHLNDVEDMLLLTVQHKLFQLDGSDIFDFIVALYKRRLGLMVDLIDKQMFKRRIIRNLERMVGAREIEMDYRLMTRTECRQDSSLETMDETFDRLQKLITQLEIQGEVITQENMNLKLLRSLPSIWKNHALIWRNKQEIETISLDDLYNNLKIYELEISGSSSTSQNPQNVAFVSSNSTNSNSSTNEADNTTYGVSAAHTQSSPTSGDNFSDVVICAFLDSQPSSPQLSQEDLEQINPDDLEEMDLQWEMAMLAIRARRFIKRTGRKLDVNGQRVGFDRSRVECYNYHKYGHFARECRAPRNQENKGREINRRTVTVETPTENALVAQDGIGGYDWSYQAEEEHLTNYALMAHTSSGSSSSSDSEVDSCSKSCVKAYATLKEQYDNLSSDYKKSQFNLVSYKAGLESVEARLAHYKKNEVVFEESINVLNLEVKLRDNALVENKKKLEKAEKERDELKLTLEKFQNSSKSLNNLLESQVCDKFKTRLGYNTVSSTAASPAVESFVNSSEMLENQEYNKSKSDKGYHVVPPPYTGNFIPFKPNLTFMDEIVESENIDITTIVTPSNVKKVESNHESADVKNICDAVEPKTVRKNSFRTLVIKDWNFDDDSEVEFIPNVEEKTVRPSTEKIKFVKYATETVEKIETPKQNKHYPRGNQRNWNNLMSQKLGSDFKMINKACFVCGSFKHLHYLMHYSSRVNHKNFANKMTHLHPNRKFVPQAILTRSGKINTAGASVNTVVRPVNTASSKTTMNYSRLLLNAYKRDIHKSQSHLT